MFIETFSQWSILCLLLRCYLEYLHRSKYRLRKNHVMCMIVDAQFTVMFILSKVFMLTCLSTVTCKWYSNVEQYTGSKLLLQCVQGQRKPGSHIEGTQHSSQIASVIADNRVRISAVKRHQMVWSCRINGRSLLEVLIGGQRVSSMAEHTCLTNIRMAFLFQSIIRTFL
jgi:hypothetical protein